MSIRGTQRRVPRETDLPEYLDKAAQKSIAHVRITARSAACLEEDPAEAWASRGTLDSRGTRNVRERNGRAAVLAGLCRMTVQPTPGDRGVVNEETGALFAA